MSESKKKTHHGGVPEEQPKNEGVAHEDGTTGGEGGGPGVGYGGNPHRERPLTIPDQTRNFREQHNDRKGT